MPKRIPVPVVVVSFNRPDKLKNWLYSVRQMRDKSEFAEVVPFIVDGGSCNTAPGIIWEAVRGRLVAKENVVWLNSNPHFVPAQNLAFRILGARNRYNFVATLNEDAVAEPDWLDSLLKAVSASPAKQRVGMLSGIILTHDKPDRISSAGHCPGGTDAAFLDIDRDLPECDPNAHYKKDDFEPFSPCFAAALWSFEMLKEVGLPDEEQLMYYDDVDLAYKARFRGWKARFVSGARARHPLPKTASDPFRRHRQLRGRLAIASRYFPEPERTCAISENLRKGIACMDTCEVAALLKEISKLQRFGTEEERRGVFEWARANRYVPTNMRD